MQRDTGPTDEQVAAGGCLALRDVHDGTRIPR
jgi:hypothetical protein